MVRIILGGQLRGNIETWKMLDNFSKNHNAKIYIGSDENWNWDISSEFVKTKLLSDTHLNNSTHPHKDSYIAQWSNLYGCYTHFKDTFSENDIIVKLRNDLVFPIFNLTPLINTIHVPTEAGHGRSTSYYNSKILCNDQIVYGYKNVMDTYFNLPYDVKIPFERVEGALSTYGELIGIEEILRSYLYQKNINLHTFKLNYKLLRFT
jgi:hypothetical protein